MARVSRHLTTGTKPAQSLGFAYRMSLHLVQTYNKHFFTFQNLVLHFSSFFVCKIEVYLTCANTLLSVGLK